MANYCEDCGTKNIAAAFAQIVRRNRAFITTNT